MKPREIFLNRALRRARIKDEKGFSLVEMIVSIAVMTVLLGALIPQVVVYVQKAQKISDVMTAASIYQAGLSLYADELLYNVPEPYYLQGKRYTYYDASHKGSNSRIRQIVYATTNGEKEWYSITPIAMTSYYTPSAANPTNPNSGFERYISRAQHGTRFLRFWSGGQQEADWFFAELNTLLSNDRLKVNCTHPTTVERMYQKLGKHGCVPLSDDTAARNAIASAYPESVISHNIFGGNSMQYTDFCVTNRSPEINRFILCYRSLDPGKLEVWVGPSDTSLTHAEPHSVPLYRIWPDPDDVYMYDRDYD